MNPHQRCLFINISVDWSLSCIMAEFGVGGGVLAVSGGGGLAVNGIAGGSSCKRKNTQHNSFVFYFETK